MRRCEVGMLPLWLLAFLCLACAAAGQTITLQDSNMNNVTSLTFTVPANTVHGASTPQTLTVLPSVGPATITLTPSNPNSWLYLSGVNTPVSLNNVATSGTTFGVSVDTTGLSANTTLNAYFTVCYANTNTCAPGSPGSQIQVTLHVTQGSGGGIITASPNSFQFSAAAGGTTATGNSNSVLITAPTSLSYNMAASTQTGGNWLLVNGGLSTSGVENNGQSIPVGISSAILPSLAVGTYNGTISVVDSASNSTSIPVTLTVGGTTGLIATPANFQFLYQIGQTIPPAQTLYVSTNSTSAIGFTLSTGSSAPWLVPGQLSGSVAANSPVNIPLNVNTVNLTKGNYSTTLIITPFNQASLAPIPVNLVVSNNPLLQLTSNTLTFNAAFAGPSPQSQTVQVTTTGSGGSVGFSANSNQPSWLSVSTSSSSTPATLTISVNSGSLPVGNSTGTITVAPSDNSYTETIAVSVTVSNAAQLTIGPSTLLFSYETTQLVPGSQIVWVRSTGPNTTFTTSVTTNNCGNNWLSVSNLTGPATPAALQVSVAAAGMTAGVCTGMLSVTPAGSSVAVNVLVTVAVSTNTPMLTIQQQLGFGVFTMQQGGSSPNPQTLILGSTDTTQVTWGVQYQSDRGWLYTTTTNGSTPFSLGVNAAASSLAAGTYGGTLTITSNSLPAIMNGRLTIPITLVVTPIAVPRVPTKVGIVRFSTTPSSMMTAEDANGNIAWDSGVDHAFFFGIPGDILIQGDWDGSGTTKFGIFRPSAGMFALDMNDNGVWDPGVDRFGFFGQSGDEPIVGDWTGDGKSKIGIYRPGTNLFALDVNNNLSYDAGIDKAGTFGVPGDVPIVGDWTGDGTSKIGIYRPSTSLFAEDVNNNLAWDPGVDKAGVFGVAGDAPIVGDWTGDGRAKVGIYRATTSLWAMDLNNNLAWDAATDKAGVFGVAGDLWVVGDWDGSGVDRAGIFRPSNGLWGLDKNGNLAWDAGIDLSGVFGATGDTPVVGRW